MPCTSPVKAYYSAETTKTGKRALVFDRKRSFSGISLMLPCGQCMDCRLEKSRQWAVRCMHEKRMHDKSSFLTLTYEEKFLPLLQGPAIRDSRTLVKRDLQLFMKRLRKKYGEGIRFYACGEYGSKNGRPHYHVLLFNHDFEDKKPHGANDRGEQYFKSDELRGLWPFGDNIIGSVDFDSCAYVARYIADKVTGPLAEEHYKGRLPEFTVMSRRPGIGSTWFDKYKDEAYAFDSVVINDTECAPPRYYDVKMDAIDPARIAGIKKRRRLKAMKIDKIESSRERLRVKEVFLLRKMAIFSRKGF